MLLSKVLKKPQLLFRVAQPNDKENIIKFLDSHFAKEEPCARNRKTDSEVAQATEKRRALKLSPEITNDTFTATVTRCLKYPFSTVVLQENGNLAACLLASVWNRTDPIQRADFYDEGVPENLKLFLQFLNSAHANFWKIAPPNINSVIHREIGSVAPGFTRGGVATKMVTTNMTKTNLKKHNIGGVISETTSLANQIVLEKAGFKCLKELPYSAIVDSKGNQVLKLDDGTKALRLNFKPIEDFKNLPE